MRRVDRANRIGLSMLSLVLLAAGGLGLARGYGAFGPKDAEAGLIDPLWRDFVRENESWFWPAVVASCLVIAWITQRWMRAQIPDPAPSAGVDLISSGSRGITRVKASAIGEVVTEDIRCYDRVQDVSARMVVRRPNPRLELQVTVDDDADLEMLRQEIQEHALSRLQKALEVGSIETVLLIRHESPLRAAT